MAQQGYYTGDGGNDSRNQLPGLTDEAGHSALQPYGSWAPPPADPHRPPYPEQGYMVYEQPKDLYRTTIFEGPNTQATYPQQGYQNSYPEQQGYPIENQQQQQQQQQLQGSCSPLPYDQRGYPPPHQQYTSSYQANSSSQTYEPGYQRGNDEAQEETPHSERGLGSRVVGSVLGHKLAKEAGLGPVATLAAGMIGGQMLSNVQKKHKHEKREHHEN